jgi:hypothetical protein
MRPIDRRAAQAAWHILKGILRTRRQVSWDRARSEALDAVVCGGDQLHPPRDTVVITVTQADLVREAADDEGAR